MIVKVIKDVTCTIHAGQTVDIKDSEIDLLMKWGYIAEIPAEKKETKKAKKQSK